MRKRIFEIIEVAQENDKYSRIYDTVMLAAIFISILPLAFKNRGKLFYLIDTITVILFIIDYILRFITADYKLGNGKKSFFQYPFTFMAIIDLLAILPSVTIVNKGFRLLKIFRLSKAFRVFRIFKTFRYSHNIQIILNVFRKQKDSLIIVCVLAGGYILVSALVVFNVEPQTFNSFFDAVYWATVSLTTVGYGDIYATSRIGKIITMFSAVFGIAIVALPSGIITAGYMNEINKNNNPDDDCE